MIKRPDWRVNKNLVNLSHNVCWDSITHQIAREELLKSDNILGTGNPFPVYTAICDYYSMNINNVVLGLGSAEVIQRFLQVTKPHFIYIVSPTWGFIEPLCKILNIPYENITIKQAKTIYNKNATLYIANPNGVTGESISIDFYNNYHTILLDEAYSDWCLHKSLLHCRPNNVFITKSLSKSLGISGARVGFGYGDYDTITSMQNIRLPDIVTKVSEIVVPKLIYHTPDIVSRLTASKIRLESMYDCFIGYANFISFKKQNKLTKYFGYRKAEDHYHLALADWQTFERVLNDNT